MPWFGCKKIFTFPKNLQLTSKWCTKMLNFHPHPPSEVLSYLLLIILSSPKASTLRVLRFLHFFSFFSIMLDNENILFKMILVSEEKIRLYIVLPKIIFQVGLWELVLFRNLFYQLGIIIFQRKSTSWASDFFI